MLGTSRVTTILPVVDLDRAHQFYSQTLGLVEAGRAGDGKILFATGNGFLALLLKSSPTKADHTAISFEVASAADAVRDLTARGIVFEDYDYPGLRTVNKVCVLGSEKAAWFKDPEGNLLCVHEPV